ncbi:ATP-grasp domain-containing protein [Brevibacterium sp. UCMA 11752]|uniref:ATP-grasp domain-containing protein n=1 Tax=Brevibacterium sp. UCMA 11752 TaxID=2745946 RepID=UPI001F1D1743|nr:ATP-grasp domain-containing protein [Brevibacterium sp. UCMA 11752]MCF2586717.1 ATP-grasp domain-containing protein [Brevibacterium sp. UCMA 11752]
MTSIPATVVIGSAGRRLYLIDWFRQAFDTLEIDSRVVVTENDKTSSSATYGDIGRIMPKYSDPAYETALLDLIADLEPQLFISVNDYELLHLHVNTDLADRMRQSGVLVPGVSAEWQRGCVDKLQTAQMLTDIGVPTAPTVSGGDRDGLSALASNSDDVVVKHRFGSGSSGLAIVSADRAEEAVAESLLTAPARSDTEPTADDVVVQPKLSGVEHGVDIVGALRAPGDLAAVLARRKLRMRAGETDKAVTVDPAPFVANSALIAEAAGLTGLIDVDMFLDEEGRSTVIDINPRFGGGYPFAHLAGADVPLYYLAQAMGIDIGQQWRLYETGVVSAKYESVRVTARESASPPDSAQ